MKLENSQKVSSFDDVDESDDGSTRPFHYFVGNIDDEKTRFFFLWSPRDHSSTSFVPCCLCAEEQSSIPFARAKHGHPYVVSEILDSKVLSELDVSSSSIRIVSVRLRLLNLESWLRRRRTNHHHNIWERAAVGFGTYCTRYFHLRALHVVVVSLDLTAESANRAGRQFLHRAAHSATRKNMVDDCFAADEAQVSKGPLKGREQESLSESASDCRPP